MILKPAQVRAVAAERKTTHREPIKGTDRGSHPKYKTGRSYPLQAKSPSTNRAMAATLRVTIAEIHKQRLGDVTLEDARAEGFKTTQDFYNEWEEQHNHLDLNEETWVIHITPDRSHQPRLLAARSQHLYTDKPYLAMADEPEALTEAEQVHYTEQARENEIYRHRLLISERRDTLEQRRERINQEITAIRKSLTEQGSFTPDMHKAIRALEHAVSRIDRQLQKAA